MFNYLCNCGHLVNSSKPASETKLHCVKLIRIKFGQLVPIDFNVLFVILVHFFRLTDLTLV